LSVSTYDEHAASNDLSRSLSEECGGSSSSLEVDLSRLRSIAIARLFLPWKLSARGRRAKKEEEEDLPALGGAPVLAPRSLHVFFAVNKFESERESEGEMRKILSLLPGRRGARAV